MKIAFRDTIYKALQCLHLIAASRNRSINYLSIGLSQFVYLCFVEERIIASTIFLFVLARILENSNSELCIQEKKLPLNHHLGKMFKTNN